MDKNQAADVQENTMTPSRSEKLRTRENENSYLAPVEYSRDEQFVNREISWLEFNSRVLDEARDRMNPLMERLSFQSITQTNLDEFFRVRVASLKDQVNAGYSKPDIAGLLPGEQLTAISRQVHVMVGRMYSTWTRSLLPTLNREGIYVLKPEQLSEEQRQETRDYFTRTVYPILTPMAVDSGRPFPLLYDGTLNIAVKLKDSDSDEERFATVQVPAMLPRYYTLSSACAYQAVRASHGDVKFACILLEDIIQEQMADLFPRHEILSMANYRITRNADLDIDEEDAEDLLIEIEKQVRLREWGEVIRLEIDSGSDTAIVDFILDSLRVEDPDIYLINGPMDFSFLSKLRGEARLKAYPDYYYPPYEPQPVSHLEANRAALEERGITEPGIFDLIKERDIFMQVPYEDFSPITEFVKQAARDPDVLAIKQTLYRVSGQSPIIHYLEEAARNGKQVMVLVELKARFDEENNIHWARRLEQAGCHVIYGLVGLKTHSKITLVVRQEGEGIRRYVHLGTGNYNDATAKVYTDMSIFVNQESFGREATEFFNMISGYAEPEHWNKLIPAPYWLRSTFYELIDREIHYASEGKEAWIRVKINSLVDEGIIRKLYEASAAGVRIDLVVRGICCLRPGVDGLSENIRVRSLVGRYLEHARIYAFCNDGRDEVYLSSADWMTRNLDRRVELLFPVEDPRCKARVVETLDLQLADSERAHLGQPDGTYVKRRSRGRQRLDSQKRLCELALERAPRKERSVLQIRQFTPAEAPVEPGETDEPDQKL